MILDKYSFVFGFGFLKELNKQHTMASNGLTMRLGLENTLPNLINNDVETLIEVLKLANKTETPRASEKDLVELIESTEDIESLFTEVLGALKESNFTGDENEEIPSDSREKQREVNYDDFLEQVYWNCVRYLGVKSFDDIARMTIPEYEMRIKAYQYEELDKQRDLHYLAFLNQAVQSTTGKGKSQKMKYTSFDKFFDYDKLAKKIEGEMDQTEEMDEHKKELLRLIKKANSANGKEE